MPASGVVHLVIRHGKLIAQTPTRLNSVSCKVRVVLWFVGQVSSTATATVITRLALSLGKTSLAPLHQPRAAVIHSGSPHAQMPAATATVCPGSKAVLLHVLPTSNFALVQPSIVRRVASTTFNLPTNHANQVESSAPVIPSIRTLASQATERGAEQEQRIRTAHSPAAQARESVEPQTILLWGRRSRRLPRLVSLRMNLARVLPLMRRDAPIPAVAAGANWQALVVRWIVESFTSALTGPQATRVVPIP